MTQNKYDIIDWDALLVDCGYNEVYANFYEGSDYIDFLVPYEAYGRWEEDRLFKKDIIRKNWERLKDGRHSTAVTAYVLGCHEPGENYYD